MGRSDTVLLSIRVVIAVVSLAVLLTGVRIAVTRRFPRPRLRLGRPPTGRRPQPVRVGGGVALVAASLLVQQAAQLLPVSRPVGIAMSLAALVIAIVGVGWFAVRRD
ncbi:hypothetical protein ABZ814_05535 [Micromonospora musae]|uniref:hypothetical protein n=1 Tax=Micromonospora musae TaxID=1894970 RepID=UPI0033CA47D1